MNKYKLADIKKNVTHLTTIALNVKGVIIIMPNKPKHHHSDRDRIYTPEDIVKKLLDIIPYSEHDTFCDPCYGKGVFYDNFPGKWII